MLIQIPDGTACFVDANIIFYHLVSVPLLSDECSDFLKRVEDGRVVAHTSTVATAEACHKVMLAEAIAKWNLPRERLAHRLQRQRDLIAQLGAHRDVVPTLRKLSFHIEVVTMDLLRDAADISVQEKLLTNDATTVAIMRKSGLTHLVTNDDNFDSVAGLAVWKPR